MSLISDALKRQEQLRTSGTGAAQHEVSAARPPEAAAAEPPEVAAAEPPEASRVSAQPCRASGPTSSSVAAPNLAAPAAQPRRASGPTSPRPAPASNPFLERERAAARRPNHSVLLMPILGLIVLLVLLFLRREFVPSSQQAAVRKVVESEKWKVENAEDAAVISDLFPEEGTGNREEGTGKREQGTGKREEDKSDNVQITDHEPATSNPLGASVTSAPLRENPPPSEPPKPPKPPKPSEPSELSELSNRQTVKSSNQAAETVPQPAVTWPSFTLTGIAVGRERLAILNTGEMLLAGETARCGVKIVKVNAATVVFAWGGETKTLRKGEHSDKPAD